MISVGIPKSNHRVWETGPMVQLTKECGDWMETYVGYRQFRLLDGPEYHPPRPHFVITNSWHSVVRNDETKIYFSDPEHAMLFKLTWK